MWLKCIATEYQKSLAQGLKSKQERIALCAFLETRLKLAQGEHDSPSLLHLSLF